MASGRHRALVAALLLAALMPVSARAADTDIAVSGFGTVGYARTDRAVTYDRFIDESGTLRRDSLVGLQIDAKAFDQFGATIQVKAAPSTNHDERYEPSISWAFLAFRPTNDWLFRVGKLRIPFYLYSETLDVGESYDFARLPVEMYSIAPSNDFVGAAVRRTFRLGEGELTLDALYGRSSNDYRLWLRDTIPSLQSAGEQYEKLIFRGGGLFLSYKDDVRHLRIGVIRSAIKSGYGIPLPSTFPFVSIFPGAGYYQVSDALPGPGVPTTKDVINTLLTLGADLSLPAGFRTTAEFVRTVVRNSDFAPRGNRGYVALMRPIDRFTPYVSFAFIKSPRSQIDAYTKLNENTVPSFIPGAAVINASQRAGADQDFAFDQRSWALGSSYALTNTSKLKAEILATRVGTVSQLVDAAPGTTPRELSFRTFSISYSVVFP